MPGPAETQAATLAKFIEGWKTFTPEAWTETWTDDCTQNFLPFTMGVPPRTKPEVLKLLPSLLGVLHNYKLEIYSVLHDASKGKAAIYATSFADTPFGDFKWTNEYAVFLTFSEDGTQVSKLEEMVDTAFYKEFFPKFQKYMIEKGAPANH
uniref:Monooxygenase dmxR10 n=1 Tax=Cryptosporiopsis sp. (strain 8999) TaxID=2572248 RepID=DMR10_CRYX8|nr:RecName: Full=Monooxygenase dmxR10; AltName: Full=Dimeric xanthone biosynthesis cluster protein R10 [Cryptosporiopsis sp. 8999]QCL09101.1 DmxR10 [Cryptosporiopsis sp. 8999]